MNKYRAQEVLLATGLTYRQLEYAIAEQYVTPMGRATGSGTSHTFDDDDVFRLRLMAVLRKLGVRDHDLRDAIEHAVDCTVKWLIIPEGDGSRAVCANSYDAGMFFTASIVVNLDVLKAPL